MGLSDSEEIQQLIFMLFLLIYLVTLLGNIGMILIICPDLQLHTPMYFFLSYLSFLELCYSTVITPKTLENLLTSTNYISFMDCFTQIYFLVFLVVTKVFFLSSMVYDHCMAICTPLQYPIVMSMRLCSALITGSYMIGFTESLVTVLNMNSLHFCNFKVISHSFCDLTPILALSCTDTQDIEISIFIFGSLNVVVSPTTISLSYMSILFTILKLNSSSGKYKIFSTCASHILGVTIFYSTMIFTYLKPKNSYSLAKDQVDSVFYTMMIPMLNPLIYSLWNKEVKNVVIRVMQKRESFRQLK